MNFHTRLYINLYFFRKLLGTNRNKILNNLAKNGVPGPGIFQIRYGPGKGLLWSHKENISKNYVFGVYDFRLQKVLSKTLKKGSIFYDIGANVGFFSILAKRLVGEKGEVFAFEPLPSNAELINKQAKLNELDIHILQTAVANKSGEQLFYLGDYHDVGSLEQSANKYRKICAEQITIPCLSISDFLQNPVAKIPDVIKIDVEGSEAKVLDGMKSLWNQGIYPILLIELHGPKAKLEVFRILGLIESYNYFNMRFRKKSISEISERDQFIAIPKTN